MRRATSQERTPKAPSYTMIFVEQADLVERHFAYRTDLNGLYKRRRYVNFDVVHFAGRFDYDQKDTRGLLAGYFTDGHFYRPGCS